MINMTTEPHSTLACSAKLHVVFLQTMLETRKFRVGPIQCLEIMDLGKSHKIRESLSHAVIHELVGSKMAATSCKLTFETCML